MHTNVGISADVCICVTLKKAEQKLSLQKSFTVQNEIRKTIATIQDLEWSGVPTNRKKRNNLASSVKSVQIRSFFWSVFSHIRAEYEKIRTRKNSVFGHFSRS